MSAAHSSATPPCVRILYDSHRDSHYLEGRADAIFLQNLLGHFPQYEQIAEPVEHYRKGEMARCAATFYIGSYFENAAPPSFLEDVATTSQPFVWMQYSIWKLGQKRLERLFGFRYERIAGLDAEHRGSDGRPGFFRDIRYRGGTFSKFCDPLAQGGAACSPEMVVVRPSRGVTLAQAVHSGTGEAIPYAIRKANRYFVADIPFSYSHESDRYLVFADLLFDILGAAPMHPGAHPALVRIEDVSSATPRAQLRELAALLHKMRIPFAVSLIPIFRDPRNVTGLDPKGTGRPLAEDRELMATLEALQKSGASFIWHGVTHQRGTMTNPLSGISGEDYEFWDEAADRRLSDDTPESLLERLDRGWDALSAARIFPQVWEVPHYRASALDYYLFANLFPWSVGRAMYAPNLVTGLPEAAPLSALWYPGSGERINDLRRRLLSGVRVAPEGEWFGQFFPYEIFGDVYGQRILPENLGYLPAGSGEFSRAVDRMVECAARNRPLRDSWASLFVHPQVLASGDREERILRLQELFSGLRALGYEFIDLDQITSSFGSRIRPASYPIRSP